MRRYNLLPPARDDIFDLVEYVGGYSDRARDVFTDALVDGFEQLADFPLMGRDRYDLKEGLRSFALNRLRLTVFYYVQFKEQDHVLIARVLRQERDVSTEDFGS